jgi:2-deoxy-D-gluconate 3-dehydrogenase
MSGLFDLSGRTAVVTGARRGIGFAMATALAEAGADIIGVSASLESHGSEIEKAITSTGRNFEGIACDFADPDAVVALGERLAARQVDILVNNAGTIERAPAAEHPLASWDRVIQVNLSSQFVLAQALGRTMLARGHGKIIFTASLLSFQGGINVNAIAPGYIATDNTQALREDPARSQAILERIPAGRWGVGGDLAGATVFLASAASDYVSGIVLPVDGGWLGR